MKNLFLFLVLSLSFAACRPKTQTASTATTEPNKELAQLLDDYWQERMQLYPLEATASGDNRYNDKLTITIAESFRDNAKHFYQKYSDKLNTIDSATLNENDLISYRLFRYEMNMNLEGFKYPTHYMPINQFWSLTLDLPVLGSGQGNQPFKTAKDYDNFLSRLSVFPAWTDTAIANMRKGIASGWVLPKALVVKILPQLKDMMVKKGTQSIFYGAINAMPDSIAAVDKQRLTAAYVAAIDSIVIPNYTRLYNFFEQEYLPKARTSSGIGALPGGDEYYSYCTRFWTTTKLTPDSIYQIGLAEVARIEAEMERIKEQTGFKGTLKEFFTFLNTDKQFFPFTTPQQVIDSFWNIKKREDPQLKKLFELTPKTPFTIRQTEAFRAASASAEYNPPSEDGTRPGIFYVPIIDARQYNSLDMVTLFLHEAIPGHHYQISLQQENKNLPAFRRFSWYGAYGEGWALYTETLGNELGVYSNPYDYFGHLSNAMHRAIRLVVDVGMHHKGMTREEAIAYMMAHELTSEGGAVAEIERYMAIPGQALAYKIGQLTISATRKQCEEQIGPGFNLAEFHTEILKDGCLPLEVMQQKMRVWISYKNE